jgi:Leucine-rich repeat (LRR) protein
LDIYRLNCTRTIITFIIFSTLFAGEIPAPIFALPKLRGLNLGWNELSGHIEEFDVASSCLVSVFLSRNKLAGQFPKSFFELTSLVVLRIDGNNFVGSVYLSSFSRLRNLAILSLSHNKLSITDNEGNNSSSYLSGLKELGVACCNITKIPIILTHLNGVFHLDLSCNKISGDIPKLIWERWSSSLLHLNLSHNLFTGMQLTSQVLPFSWSLEVLDLSSNRLQGQIPMPNSSADILDYSHNNFSSILPNFTLYLSHTRYISMSNNSINGHIPHSVCDSRSLEILDLSHNSFRGQIPHCLLEGRMVVLNLRENQFQGTLPSNITHGCGLQTIDLNGNKVQGQLPRALYNCTDLEVLDLGNNQVVDTFPSWLGRLPNLRVLVLRSNHFYGSISDQLAGDHQSKESFSSLQIIDLASNNFSGNLSSEWFRLFKSMIAKFNRTGDIVLAHNVSGFYGDSVVITYKGSFVTFERILTTLTAIDLSNNMLEGSIPESAGQLISLHLLNMSHNAFTGKIPSQLGGMTDLESLDLSCNQLSGDIPQELTDLTFLGTLNLSSNHLVGKIPQARQFSTFENSSFEGNFGLCGPPLSSPCGISPATAHVEDSSHIDVVLFLFVGLGFGIGFAASILVSWGLIGEWFVKSAKALRT